MIHFLNLIIATVIMDGHVLVCTWEFMLGDLGVKGHDAGTLFQMVQKICIYILHLGTCVCI